MKFRHFRFLLVVPFFLICCQSGKEEVPQVHRNILKSLSATTTSYPFIKDFETFVKETMTDTRLPGTAIAIVQDTQVLLLRGYGVKTYGTSDSVDIHTVFRIASVSKGFASMLAGILVQENLIRWDDKVQKYLPHFTLNNPINSRDLSIRNVLSHTSGLPLHTFSNQIEQNVPYATLRDELKTVPCTGPVGTIFAYQNVAYSLIADIAESVTRQPYEQLLHEKIFAPLGMKDASASYKDVMGARDLAMPHLRRGAGYVTTKNTPAYYSVLPAAGVNASISDMAQWLMALLGKREGVISSSTLNDIFTPEIKTPRRYKYEFFHWPQLKDAYYGLGWRVLKYGTNTVIYHGGHVNGYRSEVAFCPSCKIGIAILTNASCKLANDGVEVFLDSYFQYLQGNKVISAIKKPEPENKTQETEELPEE